MFIVCGEALFDVFAQTATPTGFALDARIGGAPFNLAVGLARMAQPVAMLTTLSRGFLGERLLQTLLDEGVSTALVQRSDAATTLSLVGTDAAGVPAYAFYGEGCADRLLQVPTTLPADARVLCLGSYTTVVGEVAVSLRALVARERPNVLIAYDPNIRRNVVDDVAVWRTQIDWMLPHTDVLKLSDEDLRLIDGGDPDRFAQQAIAQGVSLVLLTRGAAGATAWTSSQRCEVTAPATQVIDTVGAGDTFQAAALAWLAEHEALRVERLRSLSGDALRSLLGFAVQAAAITCARRGADLPRRAQLPAA
ncbi:MAG: carbohydrate kinase [Hydrogenophaga sp.]|uniref:carbohydrate kinase family protein n=1 Tax=Hydrogenophaga sp. TaxID=1904254 RepID=UPI001D771E99|nr:carbohydrate kinase [Hydrogenophaga sp.]MBX3609389.1 carbohydrate kinase [Hydrogenophaga sp.]